MIPGPPAVAAPTTVPRHLAVYAVLTGPGTLVQVASCPYVCVSPRLEPNVAGAPGRAGAWKLATRTWLRVSLRFKLPGGPGPGPPGPAGRGRLSAAVHRDSTALPLSVPAPAGRARAPRAEQVSVTNLPRIICQCCSECESGITPLATGSLQICADLECAATATERPLTGSRSESYPGQS